MSERELIVNADDFGRSELTNDGVITARERGIVTSASLMVRFPAADSAAAYARAHPQFSLGLHLDLGEWSYRDGEWVLVYERAPFEGELEAQLERFRELVGRDPTHLDSHQHVHRQEPVQSLMQSAAQRLGVPLRDHGPIRYCGEFYGQSGRGDPYPEGITVKALVALIQQLPPGTTELGCHPGLDADLDSSYRDERLREVAVLCHPRVREALRQSEVRLRAF